MKLMVVMEMGLDKEFDVEVEWEVKKEVLMKQRMSSCLYLC